MGIKFEKLEKKKNRVSKPATFYLKLDLLDKLDELAKKEKVSKGEIINYLLEQLFKGD